MAATVAAARAATARAKMVMAATARTPTPAAATATAAARSTDPAKSLPALSGFRRVAAFVSAMWVPKDEASTQSIATITSKPIVYAAQKWLANAEDAANIDDDLNEVDRSIYLNERDPNPNPNPSPNPNPNQAAAASHKESRVSRYTSSSQTSRDSERHSGRHSGGDAGGDEGGESGDAGTVLLTQPGLSKPTSPWKQRAGSQDKPTAGVHFDSASAAEVARCELAARRIQYAVARYVERASLLSAARAATARAAAAEARAEMAEARAEAVMSDAAADVVVVVGEPPVKNAVREAAARRIQYAMASHVKRSYLLSAAAAQVAAAPEARAVRAEACSGTRLEPRLAERTEHTRHPPFRSTL